LRSKPLQKLTTSAPPAIDQEDSQRFQDAEIRPGTEKSEDIEHGASDQLRGYNEREGAPRRPFLRYVRWVYICCSFL
jgi:hypothetical protein